MHSACQPLTYGDKGTYPILKLRELSRIFPQPENPSAASFELRVAKPILIWYNCYT